MRYTLHGSRADPSGRKTTLWVAERKEKNLSYVVARMEKLKSGNLGGAYRHNERLFKNHSNKDIDTSKSHHNYDLTERDPTLSYDKQIKNYINEHKLSKRAIRKDAVLCNEWVITSDKAFFDKMTPEQTKHFFETAKNFFGERYGQSNIAYATVHLDEKTPHMHLGLIPMKDGKLSSKALFGDRDKLRQIQDDLPKYLNKHGFDLQRGEIDSQKKHLKTEEFKEKQRLLESMDKRIADKQNQLEQATNKLDDIDVQISDKFEQLDRLDVKEWEKVGDLENYERQIKVLSDGIADLKEIKPLQLEELSKEKLGKRTIDGKIKLNKETFDKLYQTAVANINEKIQIRQDNVALQSQIDQHIQENNSLSRQLLSSNRIRADNADLNRQVNKLTSEKKQLQKQVERMMQQIDSLGKKLSFWKKQSKKYMPNKEFKQALKLANRIRPPRFVVKTAITVVKKIIEKSLF